MTSGTEDKLVHSTNRIKVRIVCGVCGEKFILRASRDKNGHLETGFKMCFCGNTDHIEISPVES